MIPASDVTVTWNKGAAVTMRECAEAAALLHPNELDAPLTHDDGDEYTMYTVIPQTTYPDPEKAAMVEEELDRLKAVLRSRWKYLTQRERDVVALWVKSPGLQLREMASELGISFQAVGLHLGAGREVLCGGPLLAERIERERRAASPKCRRSEARREYMREYQRRRRAEGRAK